MSTPCTHPTWMLAKDGYQRCWSIGSEDFSEDGDGKLYLQCATCLATKPLPDGVEVDYQ